MKEVEQTSVLLLVGGWVVGCYAAHNEMPKLSQKVVLALIIITRAFSYLEG
jgi:hypothetical protein